jgi:predicted transcriptional regulator
METLTWRAFALLMFILMAASPSAAVVTGGYSTVPPLAGALIVPPQDPVSISFWDLTMREMVIAICLSFCPLLVYPVEVFFSIRLALALGYRKVEQYALSFNRNRQKILETIIAHPGVKFQTLEQLTGMKEGTLKYHLRLLVMKRKIVAASIGYYEQYFENNGRYSKIEKKLILYLRNPTTRRILEILAACPDVIRKDIAESLGLAGPTVSWHMKRLSDDGIITMRKSGKAVRYTLCPAGANILQQFLGENASAACAAVGKEPGEQPIKNEV